MVRTAEDWDCRDIADSLTRSKKRRVFVQRSMSADPILVGGVTLQDPAQVRLPEHHEVSEAFTTN